MKILKYPVGFLIIIYDAVTWDPHGVGTKVLVAVASSIDMYNNDVGKRFMKKKGTLTKATLYFTS